VTKTITLTADEKLIQRAKQRARAERKSLDTVLRGWLKQYAGSRSGVNGYGELMHRLSHVAAGRQFSRAERNER